MQIGIDLGGTKTEAIGPASTSVVAPRPLIPTPRDYTATLEAITRLVAELESETGKQGTVGIGIPGVVAHGTGVVKNADSTWLIPRVRELLAERPAVGVDQGGEKKLRASR